MNLRNTILIRAARRAASARRRGVAMLLVMVALSAATVLTVSYVSSRDNTSGIATNVKHAADAQWAAASGAAMAIAVLETGAVWGSDVDPAALIESTFGPGVSVSIRVTNFEGAPAGQDDRDVVVKTTATIGGVSSVEERVVRLRPSASIADGLDPELLEFALYARTGMRLDSGSTIGSWKAGPASKSGRPVKLGVGFKSAGGLNIHSHAQTANTAFFVPADADLGLRDRVEDDRFVGGGLIPYDVPAPRASAPGSLLSLLAVSLTDVTHTGSSTHVNLIGGRYQNVSVHGNALVTMGASFGSNFNVGELAIRNGGVLRIHGDVRVVVRDSLIVENWGSIEFADENATLSVYVADSVVVDDAAIGVPRAVARNSSRSATSVTSYASPGRLRVYTTGDAGSVMLSNNAVALATIHAPQSSLFIQTDSTLLGRATVNAVRVRSGSSLLYDLSMDSGLGWSSFDGPLYKPDGGVIESLVEALDSVGGSLGLGALTAALVESLGLEDAEVIDAKWADLGLTPRDPDRVVATHWPVSVFALESHESTVVAVQQGGDTGIDLFEPLADGDVIGEFKE
ncbi:MAG: hypothetical protein EA379_00555 [Phycisphaerales bacterium]|nr:MAG: hypothetical protein EA379_00555 [Phycisphaerales bacterium]